MSYNYESIPADTRSAIDNVLNLDNDTKKAMAKLWRLYLRVNHGDTEYAEQELQNFANELQNRNQDSMLNAINQKITQIQQEEGIVNFGGLKRRKTGKKRKRNSRVASRKIRGKKRKRRN
jgi:thioredoxin-like negative regulator of GroEL